MPCCWGFLVIDCLAIVTSLRPLVHDQRAISRIAERSKRYVCFQKFRASGDRTDNRLREKKGGGLGWVGSLNNLFEPLRLKRCLSLQRWHLSMFFPLDRHSSAFLLESTATPQSRPGLHVTSDTQEMDADGSLWPHCDLRTYF